MTPLNELEYRVEITHDGAGLVNFITAKSFTEAVEKAYNILGYYTRTQNLAYRLTMLKETDGS